MLGYFIGFLACAAAFTVIVWAVSDGQRLTEEHIDLDELLEIDS